MTADHETRLYLEDRLFDEAAMCGCIRRPMGFIDRLDLKRELFEQCFYGHPLEVVVPIGLEPM